MRILIGSALLILQVAFAGAATACHLEKPRATPILVLDGQIMQCNSGLEVQFDIAMLETLPRTAVKTTDPWEPGVAIYEGVLLRDLLNFVNANGTVLTILALNDYYAELKVSDTQWIDVILAWKRNGEYLPVREKGPLKVVFPFSEEPELSVQERFSQSVWQVARISVK